ncbi:major histocompatibility complex class I-related gene protein-like [Tiliqua scincoides]|uniref:major histocompatibility complex class I-related gene protein-like n=1 Tax=Tiliqua scincoides TaxID=71010 RepID=UPI003462BC40
MAAPADPCCMPSCLLSCGVEERGWQGLFFPLAEPPPPPANPACSGLGLGGFPPLRTQDVDGCETAVPGPCARAEMGLLRWTALLLALGACSGSASHSLRYFHAAVSEPGPGLPGFFSVGSVDGQLITHYDSDTKRVRPVAHWMENVTQEDPQYWEGQTQIYRGWESGFRARLQLLMERYNQSGGLHTWQSLSGCELSEGGRRTGFRKYAYDGRDFIAFDLKTLTWTAAVAAAQATKAEWDAKPDIARYWKGYLEETCPEWLQKYLRLGAEALQRKEPPIVKVTCKDSQQGLETLLCRAHGFYPKEINVTWRKDGKVRQEDAFHGVVSPNPDGTYYTGLSIEVDPKERSRYQCHVEHDGLQDPLDVTVKGSVPVWLIAVGVILGVLGVLSVAGVIFYVIGEENMEEIQAAEDVLVSRVP